MIVPALRLALFVLGAFVAGLVLIPADARWMPAGRVGQLLRGSLAALLGAGATSLLGIAILFALGPSGPAMAAKDLCVVIGGGFVLLRRRESGSAPTPRAPLRWPQWVALGLAAAMVALLGTGWIREALRAYPDGGWDAWANWNHAARLIFRLGGEWRRALEPFHSHADYPLLLQSLVVQGWLAVGSEAPWIPVGVAGWFTVALATALTAAAASEASLLTAALAGLAFFAAPSVMVMAVSQYADLEVAAFVLCAGILLARAVSRDVGPVDQWTPFALCGAALSMAASTKNEGMLHLAAFAFALLACSPGPLPLRLRQLAALGLGALPALALLAIFKHMTPVNDLVGSLSVPALIERITTASRWHTVLHHVPDCWRPKGPFGSLLLTLLGLWAIALLRLKRISPAARIVGLAALATQLGFLAVFLTTPMDITWHMATAYDRLLFQTWPLAILSAVLAYAPSSFPPASPPRD